MVSVVYIVFSAFLIFHLSMQVIKLRRKHKVRLGDAGHSDLINAISAQSNAIEYLPIALLLLLGLEINTANIIIIHVCGITLLLGRLVHARAMRTDNLKLRVTGMQITFYVIIAMAILNMVYLPYSKIF